MICRTSDLTGIYIQADRYVVIPAEEGNRARREDDAATPADKPTDRCRSPTLHPFRPFNFNPILNQRRYIKDRLLLKGRTYQQ